MCDYSLERVASRPAAVADRLVTTNFSNAMTRGFAAAGEPNTAVCLRPGTELAFDNPPRYDRVLGFWPKLASGKVARFRQIDLHLQRAHHDAVEFADGTIVTLARLQPGQWATVLQLPNVATTDGAVKIQTKDHPAAGAFIWRSTRAPGVA